MYVPPAVPAPVVGAQRLTSAGVNVDDESSQRAGIVEIRMRPRPPAPPVVPKGLGTPPRALTAPETISAGVIKTITPIEDHPGHAVRVLAALDGH